MLGAKANVNQARQDGATPLFLATMFRNEACANTLIASKANVNAYMPGMVPPLNYAAWFGFLSTVKKLIAAGAEINPVLGVDCPPALNLACLSRQEHVIRLLIDAGVDVSKVYAGRGPKGTPLMAVLEGQPLGNQLGIVEALLAAGADPKRGADGKNALDLAKALVNQQILSALNRAAAKE